MALEHDANIDDLKRQIEGIVDPEIASRGFCYSAKLGIALGRTSVDAIKGATGLGISSFIARFLGEKYSLVAIGGRKSELVVVTRGSEQSFVDGGSSSALQSRHRRFARDLWLAFSLPTSGTARFYSPTKRASFDGEKPEGDDWIEIPQTRLRTADDEYSARTIIENIEGWLTENAMGEDLFVESRLPTAGAATSALNTTGRGVSALEVLIRSLEISQLRSVSLPLDIIETLLRKRL